MQTKYYFCLSERLSENQCHSGRFSTQYRKSGIIDEQKQNQRKVD
jgi:hypothetical protein